MERSCFTKHRSASVTEKLAQVFYGLCLIVLLFLCSSQVHAQGGVAINNIVATDFISSKEDIIEIDFSDNLPNLPFVLAWIDSTGQQYALTYKTSTEKLTIPMGIQKGWHGTIGLVGLSINNAEVTFRKTGFGDIWESFLNIHPMSPGSVNFTATYYLLGMPFRWFCGALWLVITLISLLYFRRWDISLLIAFVIAWLTFDIRATYNRWENFDVFAQQEWEIPILKDLQTFIPEARKIIEPDGTWTKEQLAGFLNSYCRYELADLTYYPPGSEDHSEAQYIITTQPDDRPVLLQEGIYYLIKAR